MKVHVIWLEDLFESLHGRSSLARLEKMAEMGNEVSVVCKGSTDSEQTLGTTKIHIVRIGRVPIISLLSFWIKSIQISKFRKERYDVVMLNFRTFPISFLIKILRWIRHSNKPAVVLNILSRPVITKGLRGSLVRNYFMSTLSISKHLVDGISAVTKPESLELAKQGGIKTQKFFILPPAVDERIFDYQSVDDIRQKIRQKLNIHNKFVLIYHGSTDLERGTMKMILAVKKVYDSGLTDMILVLLGRGTDDERILSYISRNKLDHLVILLPPVSYRDVPKYVTASDSGLIALPDHIWWRNQLPIKMLECLSLGIPVICTDLPGCRWVSQYAEGAVIFAKQDSVEFLAEAIRHAHENRADLKTEAMQARPIIVKHFSASEIAKNLSNDLEVLCSG